MKNNKLITIILFLSLIIVIIFLVPKSGSKIINPVGFMQNKPLPGPEVSNYDPPKEIKYDSSTDLEEELDSVNPKVLDSDFDSLKNL